MFTFKVQYYLESFDNAHWHGWTAVTECVNCMREKWDETAWFKKETHPIHEQKPRLKFYFNFSNGWMNDWHNSNIGILFFFCWDEILCTQSCSGKGLLSINSNLIMSHQPLGKYLFLFHTFDIHSYMDGTAWQRTKRNCFILIVVLVSLVIWSYTE